MLTMFGFIKKELLQQKKLPSKYREWEKEIYNQNGDLISLKDMTFGSYVRHKLFTNHHEKVLDPIVDSWTYTIRVNRTALSGKNTDCMLLMLEDVQNSGQLHFGLFDHGRLIWNQGFNLSTPAKSSALSTKGNIWLKASSSANSSNIDISYSTNGSSFSSVYTGPCYSNPNLIFCFCNGCPYTTVTGIYFDLNGKRITSHEI